MQAVEFYREALAKAAGDRGGHVIGTTARGHAIYASSHERYSKLKTTGEKERPDIKRDHANMMHVRKEFNGFNAADHKDAAAAHHRAYKQSMQNSSSRPAGSSERRKESTNAKQHFAAQTAHLDARSALLREGGNHISQKRGGES